MCEQCSADCIDVAEVVEGWTLVQARKDGNFMKKGEYAIGNGDNPTFYFDVTPIEDPSRGLSDDEFDNMIEEENKKLDEFWDVADRIDKKLVTDPFTGHMFYEACLKSGYDPKLHRHMLSNWLTDVMAIAIKTHLPLPRSAQGFRPNPS